MGPSANDFSNRRRPGRRGDGPGMGSGRGPARGPGGGPREGSRGGRTGRGLNDPRRPGASSFRRLAPRPEGPSPRAFEGQRWTRDREENPSGEVWRRGEGGGGGPRQTPPDDRSKWRGARREEGPPTRPFRPVRPVRGERPPADAEAPRGDSHAGAAPSELIWGRHAALAALESERPIHRIWCTPEMRFRPTFLQLLREAKASGVLVEEVTWARLGQISGGAVHQGIVLQPAAADTLDLPSLIDGCRQLAESPLLVAVDGLTDPQNLGAILRSAEALGVHGLVLPQRRNAGLTGSVAKVAAGALEHLPVARVVNLNRALESLREEGYRVVGLDPQGSVSLEEADLEGPLVVITGSEGQGLSVLTRRSCDQLVRIPLRGATPSLNASVATALVLYEVARRGWMRGLRGTAKPPRLVRPHLPSEPPQSEAQPLPALIPVPVSSPPAPRTSTPSAVAPSGAPSNQRLFTPAAPAETAADRALVAEETAQRAAASLSSEPNPPEELSDDHDLPSEALSSASLVPEPALAEQSFSEPSFLEQPLAEPLFSRSAQSGPALAEIPVSERPAAVPQPSVPPTEPPFAESPVAESQSSAPPAEQRFAELLVGQAPSAADAPEQPPAKRLFEPPAMATFASDINL
ncbi:MAG: 23S rRNA (guanosine(2251)-2'-O)-methyltransferase RlmB [Cyanobacteriota bacterium]